MRVLGFCGFGSVCQRQFLPRRLGSDIVVRTIFDRDFLVFSFVVFWIFSCRIFVLGNGRRAMRSGIVAMGLWLKLGVFR